MAIFDLVVECDGWGGGMALGRLCGLGRRGPLPRAGTPFSGMSGQPRWPLPAPGWILDLHGHARWMICCPRTAARGSR